MAKKATPKPVAKATKPKAKPAAKQAKPKSSKEVAKSKANPTTGKTPKSKASRTMTVRSPEQVTSEEKPILATRQTLTDAVVICKLSSVADDCSYTICASKETLFSDDIGNQIQGLRIGDKDEFSHPSVVFGLLSKSDCRKVRRACRALGLFALAGYPVIKSGRLDAVPV